MTLETLHNFLNSAERLEGQYILDYIRAHKDFIRANNMVDEIMAKLGQIEKVDIRDLIDLFKLSAQDVLDKVNSGEFGFDEIKKYRDDGTINEESARSLAKIIIKKNPELTTPAIIDSFRFGKDDILPFISDNKELVDVLCPPKRIDLPPIPWAEIPLKLDADCTNIILLGTTGAGKTMMLASILHAAHNRISLRESHNLIVKYYNFLIKVISEGRFIGSGTATDVVFGMPLDIKTSEKQKFGLFKKNIVSEIAPLNLVELAGEDFRRFESENRIPVVFEKLFSSENDNVIYFILDYEICVGESSGIDVFQQRQEIESAFRILNQAKVFKNSLQVNLIITKWDKNTKYKSVEDFFNDKSNELLNGIKNQIEDVRKIHRLSACNIIPFSVGKVDKHSVSFDFNNEFVEGIIESIIENCPTTELKVEY